MNLDALEVFSLYHLGLDRDFNYRFRNLHDAARYLEVDSARLLSFMEEHRMDPVTIRHVDFNLSAKHMDAQMMVLEGASMDACAEFARLTFEQFIKAREATYNSSREFEDVDWDNPLGDASK